jgi:hypothetical protein
MTIKIFVVLLCAVGLSFVVGYGNGFNNGAQNQRAEDCLLVCSYELVMLSNSDTDDCLNRCNSGDYFSGIESKKNDTLPEDNSVQL